MKAIVLHQVTEPEALHLEEVADPTPEQGEVVVRLRAASLNHRDLNICQGQYAGLRFPIIPGSDGVGEIAAIGTAVEGWKVGDAVIINPSLDWGDDPHVQGPTWRILGLPDNGTFAELVKVPASAIYPRPAGLTDEQAAALPLAGLTAYRATVTRGEVQSSDTVLITGIGGGVATFALLIAKYMGARVSVTSGSYDKIERACSLGADEGYNYKTTDWVKAVRSFTNGKGPDLIIDSTGGRTFEQALDAVRPGGRVVSYGATTGITPELTVRRVYWKQLNVRGSTMGSPADFRGMLSLFGENGLRPVVDKVFPLAEAGATLRYMGQAAQFGKIVLRVSATT
ncbi:MAG: zinc-binding dehydrogenase [Chloroflexi bacterium]|nr:zinc-binding dehydrogenase [Ktedonobacteraceae bacterium]MBV9706904.1 zinc-binding dehydrogenase [Chloroflexota bacterium]